MPGLSFNKLSLFLHIYGDHSYSEGWQLWGFNKLLPNSWIKWGSQSPFPSLRVNYESADLNWYSLQLKKKKIKKAGELGNKSAVPWGHGTEMKLADFFEFSLRNN